jgi:hypothetical protein
MTTSCSSFLVKLVASDSSVATPDIPASLSVYIKTMRRHYFIQFAHSDAAGLL